MRSRESITSKDSMRLWLRTMEPATTVPRSEISRPSRAAASRLASETPKAGREVCAVVFHRMRSAAAPTTKQVTRTFRVRRMGLLSAPTAFELFLGPGVHVELDVQLVCDHE